MKKYFVYNKDRDEWIGTDIHPLNFDFNNVKVIYYVDMRNDCYLCFKCKNKNKKMPEINYKFCGVKCNSKHPYEAQYKKIHIKAKNINGLLICEDCGAILTSLNPEEI